MDKANYLDVGIRKKSIIPSTFQFLKTKLKSSERTIAKKKNKLPVYQLTEFDDGIISFKDGKYAIRNFSDIISDRTTFDISYAFDITNRLPDSEVSCMSSMTLIEVLTDYLGDSEIDKFFEEDYGLYSREYCSDPKNWMELSSWQILGEKIRDKLDMKDPRNMLHFGRYSHRKKMMGDTIDPLINWFPLKYIVESAPRYTHLWNYGEIMQTKRSDDNNAIAINRFAEFMIPNARLGLEYWIMGLITGTARKRGLEFSEGHFDYVAYKIEDIVNREFSHMNITDHRTETRLLNGFEIKEFYIGREKHAEEVVLLKEKVGEEIKTFNGKEYIWNHEVYGNVAYPFEHFKKDELLNLLDKKEAIRVMKVTKSYIKGGELFIKEGEMYGAPYTKYNINFADDKPIKSRLEKLKTTLGFSSLDAQEVEILLREHNDDVIKQIMIANENAALHEKAEKTAKAEAARAEINHQIAKEIIEEYDRAQVCKITGLKTRGYLESALRDSINHHERTQHVEAMMEKYPKEIREQLSLDRFEIRKPPQFFNNIYDSQKRYVEDFKRFVFFADIDSFKKFNDTHGHSTGDVALKEVSSILKHYVHDEGSHHENVVIRWGGEEILGYINDVSLEEAILTLKEATEDIKKIDSLENKTIDPITLSIGIYEERPNTHLYYNIDIADKIMYSIKNNGKNDIGFLVDKNKIITNDDLDYDEKIPLSYISNTKKKQGII